MAIPPSSAVGFLCHLSSEGWATQPFFKAIKRTTGVAARHSKNDIPGIRIFRSQGRKDPFDIYFCKTKYNAYEILMGLHRQDVEDCMAQRTRNDLAFLRDLNASGGKTGE